jgi:hypothetical protein
MSAARGQKALRFNEAADFARRNWVAQIARVMDEYGVTLAQLGRALKRCREIQKEARRLSREGWRKAVRR